MGEEAGGNLSMYSVQPSLAAHSDVDDLKTPVLFVSTKKDNNSQKKTKYQLRSLDHDFVPSNSPTIAPGKYI